MSGSERCDSVSLTRSELQGRRRTTFFVIVLLPVVIAAVLFRLDPFEPVLLPEHEISRPNLVAGTLARNDNMRRGSEVIGNGRVAGPEDLVYDVATNVVYTGCRDGWIKRVKLSDDSVSGSEVVEDWVNTGGRPLGVALDHGGALIVGDANKVTSAATPNPANVAPAPSRFTRSTLVIPTPGARVTPFRPPAPTTTPPSKVPGKVPSMVNNTSRLKHSKFRPKQKIFRPPAPLTQGQSSTPQVAPAEEDPKTITPTEQISKEST